jgi:hypothetical protein
MSPDQSIGTASVSWCDEMNVRRKAPISDLEGNPASRAMRFNSSGETEDGSA